MSQSIKLSALHLDGWHGKLLNGILFQLGWFVAVLGGSQWALAAVVVMLFLHAVYWVKDKREWWLILAVTVIGTCLDSVWLALGLLVPDPAQTFLPAWLVCIWVMFSMTLSHMLSWLSQRYWLAALLGAIAGPLAYWSGAQLSGMTLGLPVWVSLLAIAVGWALLMPIFMAWSQRVGQNRVA